MVADQQAALISTPVCSAGRCRSFMDMGEMGKYQFVAHDGSPIGAIMRKRPGAGLRAGATISGSPIDRRRQGRGRGQGGKITDGADGGAGRRLDRPGMDPQGAYSRSSAATQD